MNDIIRIISTFKLEISLRFRACLVLWALKIYLFYKTYVNLLSYKWNYWNTILKRKKLRSQILLEIKFFSNPVQTFVSYPGWKVEQNFYTKIKLIRFSPQSSVINTEFSYLWIPHKKKYRVVLHFYLFLKYLSLNITIKNT